VLVIGARLQRLLVNSSGLRKEALTKQVIGDLHELQDRTIDVAGAQVQIAEGIDRVPVARLVFDQAHVLSNGEVEPALAFQPLCLPKRRLAVNWHGGRPSGHGPGPVPSRIVFRRESRFDRIKQAALRFEGSAMKR